MTEEQWQRPVSPRGRLRWVVVAAAAVVGVALLAQVEAGDTSGLEIEARDDEEPTPPTPPPDDEAGEGTEDEETAGDGADTGASEDADGGDAGGSWRDLAVDGAATERVGAPLVTGAGQALVWGGERRDLEADVLARRSFYNTGVALPLGDGSAVDLPHVPLEPRTGHVAVWIDDGLLVWGGQGRAHHLNDGARYDPVDGVWQGLARSPLTPRANASAVWTGEEVLIVGGTDNAGTLRDGAAYAPATNEWRPIADAPQPLTPHRAQLGVDAAVWTGDRLVVPAPALPEPHLVPLAYDPAADTWEELPDPPMLRQQALEIGLVAAADGELFAVGKGARRRPYVARYADGGWETLPETPGNGFWPDHWQPVALSAWTDHGLAIVAGAEHGVLLDPDTETWQTLPPAPLPELWSAQLAWTDAGLLVWPEPPPFAPDVAPEADGPPVPVLWRPGGQ